MRSLSSWRSVFLRVEHVIQHYDWTEILRIHVERRGSFCYMFTHHTRYFWAKGVWTECAEHRWWISISIILNNKGSVIPGNKPIRGWTWADVKGWVDRIRWYPGVDEDFRHLAPAVAVSISSIRNSVGNMAFSFSRINHKIALIQHLIFCAEIDLLHIEVAG